MSHVVQGVKIAVFTGSRAEYGLLVPVLRAIAQSPHLTLELLVGGAHLSELHGRTVKAILEDGFVPSMMSETLLASDSRTAVSKAMALGIIDMSQYLDRSRPDALVVLGDRYEVLAATSAALVHGVPVVHLHGGELSSGAFDDSIRHAVTKLSHVHVVASEVFAKRVVQLGESPDRVIVCRAPGVEVAKSVGTTDAATCLRDLGIVLEGPSCLLAYHPVTLPGEPPGDTVRALVRAVSKCDFRTVLMVGPNADPSGVEVRRVLDEAAVRPGFHLLPNLGHHRYLALLHAVDVIVGNSSSGIIEAPAVRTVSVNVGVRQLGRPRAASTVDVSADETSIADALRIALGTSDRFQNFESPYDGGVAMGTAVVRLLETTDLGGLLDKRFRDAF